MFFSHCGQYFLHAYWVLSIRQQQRLVERIQVRYVPFILQVPSPGEKGQAAVLPQANCPHLSWQCPPVVLYWPHSFRVSSGAPPLQLDCHEVVEEAVCTRLELGHSI